MQGSSSYLLNFQFIFVLIVTVSKFLNAQRFCGTQLFNSTTHFCCHEVVVDAPNEDGYLPDCCGLVPFYRTDNSGQPNAYCCNGVLGRGADGCCNSVPYSSKTHQCCQEVVAELPVESGTNPACCGAVAFYQNDNSDASSFCCNNVVSKGADGCCKSLPYSSKTHQCCQEIVTELPSEGGSRPDCCGNVAFFKYDKSGQVKVCCNGALSQDADACCGNLPYLSQTHGCAQLDLGYEKLYDKRTQAYLRGSIFNTKMLPFGSYGGNDTNDTLKTDEDLRLGSLVSGSALPLSTTTNLPPSTTTSLPPSTTTSLPPSTTTNSSPSTTTSLPPSTPSVTRRTPTPSEAPSDRPLATMDVSDCHCYREHATRKTEYGASCAEFGKFPFSPAFNLNLKCMIAAAECLLPFLLPPPAALAYQAVGIGTKIFLNKSPVEAVLALGRKKRSKLDMAKAALNGIAAITDFNQGANQLSGTTAGGRKAAANNFISGTLNYLGVAASSGWKGTALNLARCGTSMYSACRGDGTRRLHRAATSPLEARYLSFENALEASALLLFEELKHNYSALPENVKSDFIAFAQATSAGGIVIEVSESSNLIASLQSSLPGSSTSMLLQIVNKYNTNAKVFQSDEAFPVGSIAARSRQTMLLEIRNFANDVDLWKALNFAAVDMHELFRSAHDVKFNVTYLTRNTIGTTEPGKKYIALQALVSGRVMTRERIRGTFQVDEALGPLETVTIVRSLEVAEVVQLKNANFTADHIHVGKLKSENLYAMIDLLHYEGTVYVLEFATNNVSVNTCNCPCLPPEASQTLIETALIG